MIKIYLILTSIGFSNSWSTDIQYKDSDLNLSLPSIYKAKILNMDSCKLIFLFGIFSLGYSGTILVVTSGSNMSHIEGTGNSLKVGDMKHGEIPTTEGTNGSVLSTTCGKLYTKCVSNIDEGESYVQVCNMTLACTADYFDCQMKEDSATNSTTLPEHP